LKIYISQGIVATQLRCLSIFSNHFVTNLLQNVPVKKIENQPIFLANILIKVCGNFGGPPCIQDRHIFMDMDISMDIHAKSVDMDMDREGKLHIHGNPGNL